MAKKITTFRIDTNLWKKLKVYCAEKSITITDYIEELIRKGVDK
jgi:predicted DNA-binding ribbon-helix-helix protein